MAASVSAGAIELKCIWTSVSGRAMGDPNKTGPGVSRSLSGFICLRAPLFKGAEDRALLGDAATAAGGDQATEAEERGGRRGRSHRDGERRDGDVGGRNGRGLGA